VIQLDSHPSWRRRSLNRNRPRTVVSDAVLIGLGFSTLVVLLICEWFHVPVTFVFHLFH
jgi:hypothetical protein